MNNHINWDEIARVYNVDLEDFDDQPVSILVVEIIAALTDREPNDLDSLWAHVEPEALDTFVAHAEETPTDCRITFTYEGYTVEVLNDRRLRIAPEKEQPPIDV